MITYKEEQRSGLSTVLLYCVCICVNSVGKQQITAFKETHCYKYSMHMQYLYTYWSTL